MPPALSLRSGCSRRPEDLHDSGDLLLRQLEGHPQAAAGLSRWRIPSLAEDGGGRTHVVHAGDLRTTDLSAWNRSKAARVFRRHPDFAPEENWAALIFGCDTGDLPASLQRSTPRAHLCR